MGFFDTKTLLISILCIYSSQTFSIKVKVNSQKVICSNDCSEVVQFKWCWLIELTVKSLCFESLKINNCYPSLNCSLFVFGGYIDFLGNKFLPAGVTRSNFSFHGIHPNPFSWWVFNLTFLQKHFFVNKQSTKKCCSDNIILLFSHLCS